LVWIADNPTRRFIFNIPAWALGAFLLGLQLLSMLAARAWAPMLSLLLALFLVAVAARRHGLLSSLNFIPGGGTPRRTTRRRPTSAKPTSSRKQKRQVSDEERMDQLLDKIGAQGLHSLTKSERAELEKL